MLLILNKKPNSTLTKPLMLIILNPTPTQPQPNPTPTQPLHHHVAGSSSSTRRLPLAAAKAQSFSSSPLPHSGVMSSVDRISLPQSWALEIGDSQKEKRVESCTRKTDGFSIHGQFKWQGFKWMMNNQIFTMEKMVGTHQTSMQKWLFEFQAIETENFLAGHMVDQCIITSKNNLQL